MESQDLLSIAAETYNCHPAEVIVVYISPAFKQLPPGHSVKITIPPLLSVENYSLSNHNHGQEVSISEHNDTSLLKWQWDWNAPSLVSELKVTLRVHKHAPSGPLSIAAAVFNPDGESAFAVSLRVNVNRMADSMRYLPEIYYRDDFTNRLLMLFESFWKPISKQVDHIPSYFDPYMTPVEFLPWLGSWFGLELEGDLPEQRKRDLLAQIAPILARRGTKQSLITFLKMYTGGEIKITEHLDENFILNDDTHLGYQIALGTDNHPHTFDIHLNIPKESLHPMENPRKERQQYRRRIESLVCLFKPAHTVFNLDIKFS